MANLTLERLGDWRKETEVYSDRVNASEFYGHPPLTVIFIGFILIPNSEGLPTDQPKPLTYARFAYRSAPFEGHKESNFELFATEWKVIINGN